MNRALAKASLVIGAVSIGLMSLFQNCAPAKIVGSAGGTANQASTVGNTVNLASLLASSLEPAANLSYLPTSFGRSTGAYSAGMPVFENIILKTNDFSRIEWIQESSSTVIAGGTAFSGQVYSQALSGKYYVFGYRGETPSLLGTFVLGDKGSTNLNVNSVGAVTVNQRFLETVGDTQSFLIEVDAPAVDLKSIQYVSKISGEVIDARRAVLMKKKLSESLAIDVKLTDNSGQSYVSTINLAASPTAPAPLAPTTVSTVTTTTTVPATAVSVTIASSSLSKPSLTAGQVQTSIVTVKSATALSNMLVEIRIYTAANALIIRKPFQPVSFTAGGSLTLQFDYQSPSDLPTGNYNVQVGVWDANSATYLYETRESFSVVAPAPPPVIGVIEVETMATKTNGESLGTTWGLWSDGYVEDSFYFSFAGVYEFRVLGSSTLAAGVGADTSLRIDGVQVGAVQNMSSTSPMVLIYRVSLSAGTHRFAVAFTNDAVINGEDRNLILDRVTIAGPVP